MLTKRSVYTVSWVTWVVLILLATWGQWPILSHMANDSVGPYRLRLGLTCGNCRSEQKLLAPDCVVKSARFPCQNWGNVLLEKTRPSVILVRSIIHRDFLQLNDCKLTAREKTTGLVYRLAIHCLPLHCLITRRRARIFHCAMMGLNSVLL